jgi:Glycogen recognition site of AMP-activated protein kinase
MRKWAQLAVSAGKTRTKHIFNMNSQTTETRNQPQFQKTENHGTPSTKNKRSAPAAKAQGSERAGELSPAPQSAPSIGQETTFQFDAPSAKIVLLAGEFTEWEKAPIKMIKGGGGNWHAKVSLAPGRHRYRFLADGEWRNDSARHERVPNPFGTFDNVVEIA